MSVLGHSGQGKTGSDYEAEGKDVLDLIEREMEGLGEDDFSEWDDTATLLPR